MPAPLVTSNPAEYSRVEGLYVTEVNPPGFIQGVALNTVGIFGRTTRGPVDTPVEVASEARFLEVFGGRDYGNGGTLINHVWRDMLNKPFGSMVVVRAMASAAATASFNEEDTDAGAGDEVIKIAASSPGLWGNEVYFRIEDATNGDANYFNLLLRLNGETKTYENLTVYGSADNLEEVIGDDYGNWVVVTKLQASPTGTRPLNTEDNTPGGPYALALDTGLVTTGYMALGTTVASYTAVAGTEGTIAAADYTGTDRALDQIKNYRGVSIVLCSEGDGTIGPLVNTAMVTAAAASSDRLFLVWTCDHTDTPSDAETYVDSLNASSNDRVVACYNSPYTLDTETGTLIQVPPHAWMASILSQTEVDDHPGEEATKEYTQGISSLTYNSLAREVYASFREHGISALERDDGFVFVSGIVTDLTANKKEITRRRSADKLIISASDRLKHFVKKRNTETVRRIMGGEITDYSETLKRSERIIQEYEVDQESQNTETSRSQGLEYVLWRVDLIGHILGLVLLAEIGTGVVIEGA